MLTPDYFYGKTDKLIDMYQGLEDWILQDIAMRLMTAGEMSGTADRELYKLQQMGLHRTEIVKLAKCFYEFRIHGGYDHIILHWWSDFHQAVKNLFIVRE